jgi:hypothetical protein
MSAADSATQSKIDKNSSTYRSALLTAGILLNYSPLDQDSTNIHQELKDILHPLPCIPGSWVSKVKLFARQKLIHSSLS